MTKQTIVILDSEFYKKYSEASKHVALEFAQWHGEYDGLPHYLMFLDVIAMFMDEMELLRWNRQRATHDND